MFPFLASSGETTYTTVGRPLFPRGELPKVVPCSLMSYEWLSSEIVFARIGVYLLTMVVLYHTAFVTMVVLYHTAFAICQLLYGMYKGTS